MTTSSSLNRYQVVLLIKKSLYRKYVLTSVLSLLILLYVHLSVREKNNIKILSLNDGSYNSNIKYILYWTKMFTREDFYYGLGSKPFKYCKYTNCFTTSDKTMLPIDCFDALLFHAPTFEVNKDNYPSTRSAHQKYVFANLEASSVTVLKEKLKTFRKFYNWTFTYRRDSDIINPYGYVIEKEANSSAANKNLLETKTRQIAWFVSNCIKVTSKRDDLAIKLSKYIPVDIYGDCGTFNCPKEDENCYVLLEKKYKFYLSFENSYCKDYVTEKLFNILQYDVVPIVYGWADYKAIAPPHSVINVEDFDSVESLVKYLKYLNQNDEKYLEYFEWKKHFRVISSFIHGICNLCEKLNTNNVSKVYEDIYSWWTTDNNTGPICKTEMNLPKILFT